MENFFIRAFGSRRSEDDLRNIGIAFYRNLIQIDSNFHSLKYLHRYLAIWRRIVLKDENPPVIDELGKKGILETLVFDQKSISNMAAALTSTLHWHNIQEYKDIIFADYQSVARMHTYLLVPTNTMAIFLADTQPEILRILENKN